MTDVKPILLVIEKQENINDPFKNLENEYTIIHSNNSKEGFSLAKNCNPSLIVLESSLSPIGGYELCQKIKSDDFLCKVPVIFNINRSEQFDPCFILELGAIDYIEQTISPDILKAKVHNFVRLYHAFIELENQVKLAKELNPNTALPGNTSIVSHIYAALHKEEDLTLVYTDLDHFKSYNDCYGFGKGDQVIQLTADIIKAQINKIEGFHFLGHIGGDDFVFIIPSSHIKAITEGIIVDFDNRIKDFYKKEDIAQGYIVSKSRRGRMVQYPIVSLSMGGVPLKYYPKTTRFEEISDVCTEVKTCAKNIKGSNYFEDRRGHEKVTQLNKLAN